MADDDETYEFALPFRMNAAGTDPVLTVQDSEDEVRSCVEVLVRTYVGFHEDAPELGGRPEPFDEEVDLHELHFAVTQWEPRAEPLIEANPDYLDDLVQNIKLEARVSDSG